MRIDSLFKIDVVVTGRETPSVAGIINPGLEGFQKLFLVRRKLPSLFMLRV
ncbi:ATP citrate lyase subunit B 2, putative [Medicago truncatula]|uniref:ATP citrate lyase subunit B 2, putative n=1 Tax=Medicago truncatula TaxID=3880 RepID=A0A072V545_MEDTR|nr:ATP citrate lyase subunit B 2, putative [Medicago truncatula]